MSQPAIDNEDLSAVRAAADGDPAAFETLYRRHVATVFGMLRRILSEADADDATQETFVRAWRGISGFRGDASFRSWVFRIARSVLLTRVASRPQPMALIEEPVVERGSEEPTDDLEQAIASLPDGARAVVTLRHLCGYAHEEISQALGISVGTSKSQLHRARALLRRRLLPGRLQRMNLQAMDSQAMNSQEMDLQRTRLRPRSGSVPEDES